MKTQEPVDLVVALPHEKLVLGVMQEAGAGRMIEMADRNGDLGLARISLREPGAVADHVADWRRHVQPDARRAAAAAETPLDRVLTDLRAGFAALNGGWMPTMGKNRAVGRIPGMRNARPGVSGAGEVSHGGGGAPRKIDEPGWAKARAATPGRGARVGLVDTALRRHDYLAGAWVGDQENGLAYPDGLPAEAGHATFIAGLVLRQAPGATLSVTALLDDQGVADSWEAAVRIVQLGREGLDVLNLSFVSYTDDGMPPLVLSTAIDRLDPDIVVVAAAGNHGFLTDGQERKAAWPAALNDVVAVGAASARGDGEPASFTPLGSWIDVLAPGEDVESTYLDRRAQVWEDPDGDGPQEPVRQSRNFNGYARWSGTSFAAAAVSGAIAARTVPGRASAWQAYEWIVREAEEAAGENRRVGEPLLIEPDTLGLPSWVRRR
ncbi:S8 family peptidase [Actinoplanes aureus]|uniref:S8/S53 family peptidase n=1 Tax=Actinoplanes aureus TaxID=2792083 RepID=A0A931FZD7_9ACTN|nr:S8/S53 family peptidase [Actinoplanes aureus]MBG0564657.1 S8/S53 family peptidase [Actinoplanes aureus]